MDTIYATEREIKEQGNLRSFLYDEVRIIRIKEHVGEKVIQLVHIEKIPTVC